MNRNILAAWTLLGCAVLFAALPFLAMADGVSIIFQASVNRPLNVPGGLALMSQGTNRPIRMDMDPTSPGRMFGYSNLVTGKIKMSTDYGVTWADVPTANASALTKDVVVSGTGRMAVMNVQSSSSCTVELSDDQGLTWLVRTLITGVPNRGCFLYGATNGDRVISNWRESTAWIVAQHDVWKGTDNLNTWVQQYDGGAVSHTLGTVLYDSTLKRGAGPSGFGGVDTNPYTDGNDSWSSVTGALNAGCNGAWHMGGQPMFACAKNPGPGLDFRAADGTIIYADVKLNGVSTWIGASANGLCFPKGNVCYMTIQSNLDLKTYLFYSRNNGASWIQHPAAPFINNLGATIYLHSFSTIDEGETIFFCGPSSVGNNGVWRIAH